MAKTKVKLLPGEAGRLLQDEGIKTVVMQVAEATKAEAEATAQDAQGGPGGGLTGYAEAGFSVVWEPRSKRPRAIVQSNLTDGTQWRVHFSTIKRWGIAHLRRALYKQTKRGG